MQRETLTCSLHQTFQGLPWNPLRHPPHPAFPGTLLNSLRDCLTTRSAIVMIIEQNNHVTFLLTTEILVPTVIISWGHLFCLCASPQKCLSHYVLFKNKLSQYICFWYPGLESINLLQKYEISEAHIYFLKSVPELCFFHRIFIEYCHRCNYCLEILCVYLIFPPFL